MPISLHAFFHWLHVLAAAAWFGEVFVINVVLLPYLSSLGIKGQADVLSTLFPRLFRTASFSSSTAVISGVVMILLRYPDNFAFLWTTNSGILLSTGGLLGLSLAIFHFTIENRVGRQLPM